MSAKETRQEQLARMKKKYAKKSVPILIMESQLWDWNPTKRMLLLVLALGTRTNAEAWVQDDCPKTSEEMLGWCDMAQWRLALRVGVTEDYVQHLLKEFEEKGVIII